LHAQTLQKRHPVHSRQFAARAGGRNRCLAAGWLARSPLVARFSPSRFSFSAA
jgi:hypothetical protein